MASATTTATAERAAPGVAAARAATQQTASAARTETAYVRGRPTLAVDPTGLKCSGDCGGESSIVAAIATVYGDVAKLGHAGTEAAANKDCSGTCCKCNKHPVELMSTTEAKTASGQTLYIGVWWTPPGKCEFYADDIILGGAQWVLRFVVGLAGGAAVGEAAVEATAETAEDADEKK